MKEDRIMEFSLAEERNQAWRKKTKHALKLLSCIIDGEDDQYIWQPTSHHQDGMLVDTDMMD